MQVGALIAVDSAIERSARAHIKSQLSVTAQVFERVIDARSRRLVEAARILTGDFPFRQVVVLGDHEHACCRRWTTTGSASART